MAAGNLAAIGAALCKGDLMPDDACRAELGGKIASCISYAISGGLVAGQDLLYVLDHHATAIGAVLGVFTFFLNWHYQKKAADCRCRILGIDRRQHNEESHPHRRAHDPLNGAFTERE